jgi:hypothetical protein
MQQNLSILEVDDNTTKLDAAGGGLECTDVLLLGRSEKKIKNIEKLLKAPSVVAGPRNSYFCLEIWFS